jgi:hypothetical protein
VPRAKPITTITYDGPFFRNDPAKTFRQNIRGMMDAVAAEGERDVVAQLRAGEASRRPVSNNVGRVSEHVRGRTRSLAGKRWAVTAVVSVNNRGWSRAQGIALMAAAAGLERRVGAFRKTKNRIGRARKVNMAELLKGIE